MEKVSDRAKGLLKRSEAENWLAQTRSEPNQIEGEVFNKNKNISFEEPRPCLSDARFLVSHL